jgi:hypothetical protein
MNIDREKLIEWLENVAINNTKFADQHKGLYLYGTKQEGAVLCALNLITAIQSGELQKTEPFTWVPVTNGRGGYECSKCQAYAPCFQSGNEYFSPFCPNCGCKLEDK